MLRHFLSFVSIEGAFYWSLPLVLKPWHQWGIGLRLMKRSCNRCWSLRLRRHRKFLSRWTLELVDPWPTVLSVGCLRKLSPLIWWVVMRSHFLMQGSACHTTSWLSLTWSIGSSIFFLKGSRALENGAEPSLSLESSKVRVWPVVKLWRILTWSPIYAMVPEASYQGYVWWPKQWFWLLSPCLWRGVWSIRDEFGILSRYKDCAKAQVSLEQSIWVSACRCGVAGMEIILYSGLDGIAMTMNLWFRDWMAMVWVFRRLKWTWIRGFFKMLSFRWICRYEFLDFWMASGGNYTLHDFVLCLHIKRGCENISLYGNGDVWQALDAAAFTVCFGWQLCTGGGLWVLEAFNTAWITCIGFDNFRVDFSKQLDVGRHFATFENFSLKASLAFMAVETTFKGFHSEEFQHFWFWAFSQLQSETLCV